jgi:hypothetical protein
MITAAEDQKPLKKTPRMVVTVQGELHDTPYTAEAITIIKENETMPDLLCIRVNGRIVNTNEDIEIEMLGRISKLLDTFTKALAQEKKNSQ